ncbi:MAG: 30S ribosomal protein S17 [Lentisphaeria bacterium]|nr:30S ribosomal protein S17 [Lentisphaeria bacterium]
MNETSTKTENVRGNRKSRVGQVVSDVQNKTIVVEVERRTSHKRYKKVVKSRKRYAAHDETNQAKIGDMVRIAETRPISKNKCWRLVEIISRPE